MSSINAQIGNLGIFGSVTPASRNSIRYVYLAADGWVGPDHFLPVNGLGNFNFYYLPEGNGFIPGGNYRVYYYAADKITHYGYDTVSYSPNGEHTNGVEVRPFNDPPATPRGVHGVIYGRIDGVAYPIPEAQIFAQPLFQLGQFIVFSRSNANGYFSIYHKNGYEAKFLPVYFFTVPPAEYYRLEMSGTVNGCFFVGTYIDVLWQPANPDNPNDASYFVAEAEYDIGNIYLNLISCQ